jgi:hypothetical protein
MITVSYSRKFMRLLKDLIDQVVLKESRKDLPQKRRHDYMWVEEGLCLGHGKVLLEHFYQLGIIVSIALACYHAPENIQYGQKEVRPNPQHSIRFLYFFLYLLNDITNLEFDDGLHGVSFSKTEIPKSPLGELSHFHPKFGCCSEY